MTNSEFLEIIKESFRDYLSVGTSRSTKKLKTLHGHIASDLKQKFGEEFEVNSQGYGDDKEGSIQGRYYAKNADITIKRNGKAVAGYAVKFVVRNYSQNSNNYFENMLGETANIRSNSIPYFQIFIVFEKVPYYSKGGDFRRYDSITNHNLDKYSKLSEDDPSQFFHTPDKTLFVLIRLKEEFRECGFKNAEEYRDYYMSIIADDDLMKYSEETDVFGNGVIFNNYEDFLSRTYHIVMGRLKD